MQRGDELLEVGTPVYVRGQDTTRQAIGEVVLWPVRGNTATIRLRSDWLSGNGPQTLIKSGTKVEIPVYMVEQIRR